MEIKIDYIVEWHWEKQRRINKEQMRVQDNIICFGCETLELKKEHKPDAAYKIVKCN